MTWVRHLTQLTCTSRRRSFHTHEINDIRDEPVKAGIETVARGPRNPVATAPPADPSHPIPHHQDHCTPQPNHHQGSNPQDVNDLPDLPNSVVSSTVKGTALTFS
jgi:hypothetical protein